jgi:DNA-binding NtrC family response regulator
MKPARALLAMPSTAEREQMAAMLHSLGFELSIAGSAAEAARKLQEGWPSLAVLSGALLEGSPEDLQAWSRARLGDIPVVLLPSARGAGGLPASELLATLPALFAALGRASERDPGPTPAVAPPRRSVQYPFVGESPAIQRASREALKALVSESPVLIEGETGTGKGVLAEWLHRHGPRSDDAFVDLNCAGLSRELLESELFGHERGAFTGAISAKRGLLEVADGGTLFLDEIGDLEPTVQAKLLKVIEEKRFRRIGDTRVRQVDVRIIAATRQDLTRAVREGRFREDLYYRVGVLSLRMPALQARRQDIPLLARRLLASLSEDLGRPSPGLTPEAERALMRHPWPGNLRELRNELERALLSAGAGPIDLPHLSLSSSRAATTGGAVGETLVEVERAHIERVLGEEGGHVERAARRLGVPRSTFYQMLRALGLPSGRAPRR